MNTKAAYISVSPERRNPDLQLLTLPEAAALLLASLQKPQEGTDVVTSFSSGLRNFAKLSSLCLDLQKCRFNQVNASR